MNKNFRNIVAFGASLFLMGLNASAESYNIQEHMSDINLDDAGMIDFSEAVGDRDSRFYIGAGLGLSLLDIDNEADPLVTLDEDQDTAFEFLVGYSFSDNFKVEGYYADLGQASIVTPATNPNALSYGFTAGTLDYGSIGLSGIWAYPILSALDVFVKVGYSAYSADGAGLGVVVEEDNSSGVHLGIGAEYALTDKLGLRLAYNLVDKDHAHYLAGNIIYYFGNSEPEEIIEPIAPVINTPTPEKQLADLAKNVYFITNRTELTASAKRALDDAAQVLKDNSYLNVTIGAHTDSRGDDAYNQTLSDGRASSVVNYLIARGVSSSRMASRGFGESRPIASNDNAEGRAQNRRVEIRTVK